MNKAASVKDASLDERALLQARILARLFRQRVQASIETQGPLKAAPVHPSTSHAADRMVLKGGLAMRVVHHSMRHTKDIDLDADHDLSLGCVQTAVRRAIKEATAGGWLDSVQITEPKQTATVARWKIQGVLPSTGAVMHLTVEVSFRHHLEAGETTTHAYAVPRDTGGIEHVDVPVYRDQVRLTQKIEALLSPTRDAPRDVVDLFIMFQAGISVPAATLADRLQGRPSTALVKELWNKLDSMDEARFRTEILPHWDLAELPPEWRDWEQIRLYVGEKIEALLLEAPPASAPPSGTLGRVLLR